MTVSSFQEDWNDPLVWIHDLKMKTKITMLSTQRDYYCSTCNKWVKPFEVINKDARPHHIRDSLKVVVTLVHSHCYARITRVRLMDSDLFKIVTGVLNENNYALSSFSVEHVFFRSTRQKARRILYSERGNTFYLEGITTKNGKSIISHSRPTLEVNVFQPDSDILDLVTKFVKDYEGSSGQ